MVSNNFQSYKQLNLIGAIIMLLFSGYLMISIPSTISSFEYGKKEITDLLNKSDDKNEVITKVEQNFSRISRNDEIKVKLLYAALVFNFIAVLLLLANFFGYRRLNQQPNIETNNQK